MQEITLEAEKKYPDLRVKGLHDSLRAEGYIERAKEDEGRVKELLDAVKKISIQHTCKEQRTDPNGDGELGDIEYGYDTIIEISRKAIANYYSPKP